MKPLSTGGRFVATGATIFQRMFTRLGCQGRPPHFVVQFYPYANLVHTIRLRKDTAYVRLSDVMRSAPPVTLEAAASLLLARLYRRRVPREQLEIYRRYTLSERTRQRVLRVRRGRGRRVENGARGEFHDLARMFGNLNQRYFARRLRRPKLGWSSRAWRRQLGCFDPGLDQIVINRRLDRSDVPDFAVECVLFHEMLHVKHPMRAAACGLQSHSAEFRREERRFVGFERARRFLERLA